MFMRKIYSGRIDSDGSGNPLTYKLTGRPGGRMVKVVQYMVKVLQSSGTGTQVGMDVQHGPDGDIYKDLKFNVIPFTSAATPPILLEGSVGNVNANNEVIGEWILPILKIQEATQSGARWANVEVWEMRKPF